MLLQIKLNNKRLIIKDGRGLWSGTIGLMFNNFKDVHGCLIKTNSIHTAFCKPLHLLWLDKDLKIIKIQNANPYGVYSCKNAVYCLELKKGLVKAKRGRKLILRRICAKP